MPVPPMPMRCTFTIAADGTQVAPSRKALLPKKIGYDWLVVDPRHERRQHFRGKARPGRVMHVRFRAPGHRDWIDAETRNIGVGGAFIATSSIEDVGNDDEHDPDGSTIAFERAQLIALRKAAVAELEQLDAALERVERGTFGVCAVCGAPIASERLDVLPATTTCVACAR